MINQVATRAASLRLIFKLFKPSLILLLLSWISTLPLESWMLSMLDGNASYLKLPPLRTLNHAMLLVTSVG
jgi:hypothetical protein